jgi:hypothetical protein
VTTDAQQRAARKRRGEQSEEGGGTRTMGPCPPPAARGTRGEDDLWFDTMLKE